MSSNGTTGSDELIPNPAEAALSQFLASHPRVECAVFDANSVLLLNPWGEDGFALRIDVSDLAAINALNGVILPEKFTAVWHKDTNDLEVIWAPIATEMDEAFRVFEFHFEGSKYTCEYSAVSPEVVALAKSTVLVAARPVLDSSRFHNLSSIASFESRPKQELPRSYRSTSFWIRNVEWNEDEVVRLARNLNFHMYTLIASCRPCGSRREWCC